jgi:hypothetical protein
MGWMYAWMVWFPRVSPEGILQSRKRPLASFPDLQAQTVFSGSFFPKLSFWFADHFPMRDTFVRTVAAVEAFHGRSLEFNSLVPKDCRAPHFGRCILG